MTVNIGDVINRSKEEWKALQNGEKPLILVGTATCGRSAGSLEVLEAFREESCNLGIDCNIIEVGCIGLCYAEPIACITKPSRPGICYGHLNPGIAKELIESYLINDNTLPNYALGTFGDGSLESIPRLFQAGRTGAASYRVSPCPL